MIILPAIDLKDGKCVRLFQGDYATAEQVAEDPVKTAQSFEEQGARWVHLVDLDGAKARRPVNDSTVFSIRDNVSMNIEVGGGIRDMDTVEYYLSHGINRIILGSAALHSPEFVREAVKKYGKKIAVGIDALKGKVAAEGWTAQSEVDYLEMAKRMEDIGVRYLIVTDIYKDGTMNGPNLVMLDKVNRAVSCNIIASGGVSNLKDIVDLNTARKGRADGRGVPHRQPQLLLQRDCKKLTEGTLWTFCSSFMIPFWSARTKSRRAPTPAISSSRGLIRSSKSAAKSAAKSSSPRKTAKKRTPWAKSATIHDTN